jgi:hypothetical protein
LNGDEVDLSLPMTPGSKWSIEAQISGNANASKTVLGAYQCSDESILEQSPDVWKSSPRCTPLTVDSNSDSSGLWYRYNLTVTQNKFGVYAFNPETGNWPTAAKTQIFTALDYPNKIVYPVFGMTANNWQLCLNFRGSQPGNPPVLDANYTITHSGEPDKVGTAANGDYCWNTGNINGLFDVSASSSQYYPAWKSVDFTDGFSKTILMSPRQNSTAYLNNTYALSGVVNSSNGLLGSIPITSSCSQVPVYSANDGSYSITGIQAGQDCSYTAKGPSGYSSQTLRRVILNTTSGFNFFLSSSLTPTNAEMSVWAVQSEDGTYSNLKGASITISCQDYRQPMTKMTDSAGRAVFQNLREGCMYDITASKDGYSGQTESQIPVGQETQMVLTPSSGNNGCGLTGVVRMDNGSAQVGQGNVQVQLSQGGAVKGTSYTDSSGSFMFDVACGQTYDVSSVSGDCQKTSTVTIKTGEGSNSDVTIICSQQEKEGSSASGGFVTFILGLIPLFEIIIVLFLIMVITVIANKMGE